MRDMTPRGAGRIACNTLQAVCKIGRSRRWWEENTCERGLAYIAFFIPIYASIALPPLIGEQLANLVTACVKEEYANSQISTAEVARRSILEPFDNVAERDIYSLGEFVHREIDCLIGSS